MKRLLRIICWLSDHNWSNGERYPTHGYMNLPVLGSNCIKCGLVEAPMQRTVEE